MRCWNCGQTAPERARVCPSCEANLTDPPTQEEIELVQELLEGMDPEMLEELQRLVEQSSSAEEFADRLLVGDCPRCGSSETGNCENDPEIADISLGRCFSCGHLWCTLCERPMEPGETCSCDAELDL